MKTARFLADQLRRLHEAGDRDFHHSRQSRRRVPHHPGADLAGIGQGLRRARGSRVARRGGLEVAVHGVSFAQKHAPESLLPKFRPPAAGTRQYRHAAHEPRRLAGSRPLRALRACRSPWRRLRLLGARPHSSAVRGAGQGGDRDAGKSPGARHQRGGPEVGDAGRRSATTARSRSRSGRRALRSFERASRRSRRRRGLAGGAEADREGGFSPRAPRRRASIWSRGSNSPARRRSPGGCARTPTCWRRNAARLAPRSARPGSTRSSSTASRRERLRARR